MQNVRRNGPGSVVAGSIEGCEFRPQLARQQQLAKRLDKEEISEQHGAVDAVTVRPGIASVLEQSTMIVLNSKAFRNQAVEQCERTPAPMRGERAIRM